MKFQDQKKENNLSQMETEMNSKRISKHYFMTSNLKKRNTTKIQ
jgi:hypothetical protein